VDYRSQGAGRHLTAVITALRVDGSIILFNGEKEMLGRFPYERKAAGKTSPLGKIATNFGLISVRP
jgi:hypothetical protein